LVGQASRLSRKDGQDARPHRGSAMFVITFENCYIQTGRAISRSARGSAQQGKRDIRHSF